MNFNKYYGIVKIGDSASRESWQYPFLSQHTQCVEQKLWIAMSMSGRLMQTETMSINGIGIHY
ncbi:hypothetical protein SLEP1_g42857 [Rubroshorea leprosula]|uniref:Uncharacterized protein n=1 Tax=Rubroshorea leprosula TaxID=152421 RepID=A0AAV5LB72_9ROSI|nr:hypothetical protein SLEP1_g42857 [Rubroshorea leprosula]